MKYFNHNPEQQNALLGLLRDSMQKVIAIDFNDPEKDQQNIRISAYQKGKIEILQAILADDFNPQEPETPNQE